MCRINFHSETPKWKTLKISGTAPCPRAGHTMIEGILLFY